MGKRHKKAVSLLLLMVLSKDLLIKSLYPLMISFLPPR